MEQRCPNCFGSSLRDGGCPDCGWSAESAPEPDALPPGTRLGEGRLVGGVLRRTPRSIVYRGWDDRLDLPLAIEEYFPAGLAERREDRSVGTALASSGSESFAAGRQRFVSESRRLMRIRPTSGVAAVADLVQEAGTAYRVGKLLDGIWLQDFLKRRSGGLTREPAMRITSRVLEALEAAHDQGLTHGAVGSETVMLCRTGEVKLLDFGGEASEAEDVRAAAKLLYLLMTGRPAPQVAGDAVEGLEELAPHERSALLSALGVTDGLRFETVKAFREALEGAPAMPAPVMREQPPAPAPVVAAPPPPPPPVEEPADPDRTRLLEPVASKAPVTPDAPEPPDAVKTRLMEPAKTDQVITRLLEVETPRRAEPPTVIIPSKPAPAAPMPPRRDDLRPPLSPLFLAAVGLLGLLLLVALAWLPYRYFTGPAAEDDQAEVVPPESSDEQTAPDAPPAAPAEEPEPPPDEPPQDDPDVSPQPYPTTPSVQPESVSPPPPAYQAPAPQPQPAGFDSRLAGAWSARIQDVGREYDCLFRVETSGEYFLSADCPGAWTRAQGTLQAANGAWMMQSSDRRVQRGTYGFDGASLVWRLDGGPEVRWSRGATSNLAPSQPQIPDAGYEQLVREGARDGSSGNVQAAVQKLQEAAQQRPNDPGPHAELFALAVNRLHDYSMAYDEGEKAIRFGGEIAFAVIQDGDWTPGRLVFSKKAVSFRPETRAAGFTVSPRDIREIERNKGMLRGILRNVTPQRERYAKEASFRVRTEGDRYNFAPRSGSSEEAELVVRLAGALR